ncbi:MAG: rhomboid family intramembrane serine protease [Cytophagales bacterium]|nr:rhomboid family intramembrane serine protease [Bernardetiaceae bacterium]MDW8211610.1 rhomboid family intramembrane serine protease [Cytophagales bacterium]
MRSQKSLLISILLTAPIWIVGWVQLSNDFNWARLGVFPRTLSGMIGIVTTPLIHGDWLHLFSNLFPLIMLIATILMFYPRESWSVLLMAYLGANSLLWLLGRSAYHIGASGQVYALLFFLFFCGLFRGDRPSLAIAAGIFILYGGTIEGIFPQPESSSVSWESHLLGALTGIVAAWIYRRAPVSNSPPSSGSPSIPLLEQEGYLPLQNAKMRYLFKPTQQANTKAKTSLPLYTIPRNANYKWLSSLNTSHRVKL